MKFSAWLFYILKRIAANKYMREASSINEDGSFCFELRAIHEGEEIIVATISENPTEDEIQEFERQFNLLEAAVAAQDAEDAEREIRIRQILGKMTKEERLLIERPLPEDLPPDDDGEEHY